jgi:dynein heavy chain
MSGQDPATAGQPPQKEPPWDAIRFLISDVTYGGRVTDDWDRRLLNVYANEFFNKFVLFDEKHKLGTADQLYYIPEELTAKEAKNLDKTTGGSEPLYYAGKIKEFPTVEKPETFG